MIGFDALGRMGRLGNQMFQYAALRGLAAKHGTDFCLPVHRDTVHGGIGSASKVELFEVFEMGSVENRNIGLLDGGHAPVARERSFHFDEEFFGLLPDRVTIQGHFQSEKWFKHVADVVRSDFTFHSHVLELCTRTMSQIGAPLALHVRRTDYVLMARKHPPLGEDYYCEALGHFGDDRIVVVFSDDVQWCMNAGIFDDERFLISESDQAVDLCLMSMCSDFIIANSSFSWWGAWLADRGQVIAPSQSRWFGADYTKTHDTKDLCPGTWVRI